MLFAQPQRLGAIRLVCLYQALWLGLILGMFTPERARATPAASHGPSSLTLQQAHEIALKNHPRISVAQLLALAAHEATREVSSAYLPQVSANVMAVGTTEDTTRLSAIGGLNNPAIFDRNAEGLMVSQLITDFGRTKNLMGSAKSHARAEAANAQATREQILLAVDAAFFGAQEAQSVVSVANQTIAARQTFLDQVSAEASKQLKTELDLSFARVNVQEARLLLSKAKNDLQSAFTQLSNLLGMKEPTEFNLIEQPMGPPPRTNVAELVQAALQDRPDLVRLREEQRAAEQLARADRDARLPVIEALGSAGVSPIHDTQLPDYYAAAGVSLSVPIFAGGYYAARQHEAEFRAQAAAESLRDLENNVVRDVHLAWLNSQNAYERLQITRQLLDNAKESYDLAKARYDNGISSIVEFNQAELSLISAQITYANTQFEYMSQSSALSFQTGSLK